MVPRGILSLTVVSVAALNFRRGQQQVQLRRPDLLPHGRRPFSEIASLAIASRAIASLAIASLAIAREMHSMHPNNLSDPCGQTNLTPRDILTVNCPVGT